MSGPYVPIEDLAKHFSVSVSTIRAWVRQGHIPKETFLKVGNTYRFCIEDVAEALTKKPMDNGADTHDTMATTVVPSGIASVGTIHFTEQEAAYDLDDDM
jgi:excisionase family DNA binding protein